MTGGRPTLMRLPALVLVVLTFAACGQGASQPGGATIRGTVVAGPACPVERAESPCPPKPWTGTVRATASDGTVHEVATDATGAFVFEGLPAGSYTLVAVTSGPPPTGIPTDVTVGAGADRRVDLQVDTGVR